MKTFFHGIIDGRRQLLLPVFQLILYALASLVECVIHVRSLGCRFLYLISAIGYLLLMYFVR
jgi:hypothetical protein